MDEIMTAEPYPVDRDVIVRKIRAFKAQQPIGDLYLAVVDFKLVQQMTFFDVRRRLQKERDVEKYLGIQRPLNEGRVRDLIQYVNFIDATFPTSVILAVESDYVLTMKRDRSSRFQTRDEEASDLTLPSVIYLELSMANIELPG
jgi:DGQHR domain-containing protein